MKVAGPVYSLLPGHLTTVGDGSSVLRLDAAMAAALHVEDASNLYAVGFRPATNDQATDHPGDEFRGPDMALRALPWATIVATPFTPSAWPKLFRVSFLAAPRPGGLHRIAASLGRLGFHVVSMQSIDALHETAAAYEVSAHHALRFLGSPQDHQRTAGPAAAPSSAIDALADGPVGRGPSTNAAFRPLSPPSATCHVIFELPARDSPLSEFDDWWREWAPQLCLEPQDESALERLRAAVRWATDEPCDDTDEVERRCVQLAVLSHSLHAYVDQQLELLSGRIAHLLEVCLGGAAPGRETDAAGTGHSFVWGSDLRVEWVFPLRILRNLGTSSLFDSDRRWFHGARRVTVKPESPEDRSTLCIGLSDFQGLLWPFSDAKRDTGRDVERDILVAVAQADPEQQVAIWHIYALRRTAVLRVRLRFARTLAMHVWLDALFGVLAGKANIVQTSVSTRLSGGTFALDLTAVVPYAPGVATAESRLREVARAMCFLGIPDAAKVDEEARALVKDESYARDFPGREGEPPSWRYGREVIAGGPAHVGRQKELVAARVEVDDFECWTRSPASLSTIRTRRRLYAPNPFVFTRPVAIQSEVTAEPSASPGPWTFQLQRNLHDPAPSRRALVDMVVESLRSDAPRNFVLVGAHRSGKSSLLLAICDELKGADLDHFMVSGASVRVTEIDSAARRLAANAEKRDVRKRYALVSALVASLGATTVLVAAHSPQMQAVMDWVHGVGLAGLFEKFGSAVGFSGVKEAIQAYKTYTQREPGEAESPVNPLTLQTRLLLTQTMAEQLGTRLIVVADELLEPGSAGEAESTWPALRAVVEAGARPGRRKGGLAWVMSMSHSTASRSAYSPLANVFHEVPVSALRYDEAWNVVSGMCASDSGQEPGVVVAPDAQHFLVWVSGQLPYILQVLCYRVYESAVTADDAIVTVRDIIELLETEILVDLSEYFEHQLAAMIAAVDDNRLSTELTIAVPNLPDAWRRGQRGRDLEVLFDADLSARARRALRLAGLSGPSPATPMAPLFAWWLAERRRAGAGSAQ